MNEFNKKIIILILILTFIFSPYLAIKVKAQWVVFDPSNFVPNALTAVNTTSQTAKDFGFDAVAWIIVNLIIERMSAATVNWINGGFKGSPAYVTDPQAYFTDIGDKIAGQYIFTNKNLDFLCGTMGAKIKLALSNTYYNRDSRNWKCTLTDAINNVDAFMGNFENGGWENFFELTQKQQNNPIGAYLKAEGELAQKIQDKTNEKQSELGWGQGFMSWKECEQYGVAIPERRIPLPDGGSFIVPASPGPCLKEKTNTPGSVISTKLNEVLNIGNNKLAAADEINEIVSALLNKLVTSVVGGIGKGLRGLSKPDPASGNQVFSQQLSTSKTIVDYFCVTDPSDINYDPSIPCNTPDTTILDKPVPPPTNPLVNPLCNPADPSFNPNDPSCPHTATTP